MCFGPSSSRRLRARERVQQLACIVAVPLDPSPPPAASSPTLAAERPREHSAPTCFNGARLLPLLPGVVYPSASSESIARRVPAPSRARWPSPEPRPDVPGGTRAHPSCPPIYRPPTSHSSTPATSPHSLSPPQPLHRALERSLPAIAAMAASVLRLNSGNVEPLPLPYHHPSTH